ncbi:MAG: metallophosphoesterase family protein [Candidatus Aenigmatarchaeota archaeon]
MEVEKIFEKSKKASSKEMIEVIEKASNILGKETLCYLPKKGNLIVVGDLHGDLESLYSIVKKSNFNKKDFILFLGDYGDRGKYSPEVYYTVLSLKAKYPKRIFLLCGNHEAPQYVEFYPHDLPLRLSEKYGEEGEKIYRKLYELFDKLYVGAILPEKYVFLHGGVPINLSSLEEIEKAKENYPEKSDLIEILWNDPGEIKTFEPNYRRGIGYLFGKEITEKVLKNLRVKTLIRSHQPPFEGIKVNHEGKILTISSTKIYGGKAAFLRIKLEEKAKNAYELVKNCVLV